jgi:exodeoxyribonuclease V alpha subunit
MTEQIRATKSRKLSSAPAQLELFQQARDIPEEKSDSVDALLEASYEFTGLFDRLSQSTFRSRFHLKEADKRYVSEKGLETIRLHARDFISKRLAPEHIPNDGKQTPMRGHPVFLAQHATGCCCRGCLLKWHHIPTNRQLTEEEQRYVVAVLMVWIEKEVSPQRG